MAELGTWEVVGLVAGSSVLAAALNQAVSTGSAWVGRSRDRNFGRLYLALALEHYASECSSTISESETFEASGGRAGSPQGNIPPLPPFPQTVDWKAMGLHSTNQLLSYRVEVDSIRAQISDSLEYDEDGAIADTRQYAAALGLKALRLARDLRLDAGAPQPQLDLDWSVEEYLESKEASLAEKRRAASRIGETK